MLGDPVGSKTVGLLAALVALTLTFAVIGCGDAFASSSLPSKPTQISVLENSERMIDEDINTNGAVNSFYGDMPLSDLHSFGIYPLWNRGIDGAGTTVAVIEGWEDPNVQSVIDTWDSYFQLPNPDIKTIYPAGPLPKKCPAADAALWDAGCDWDGELELDVEAVHLLAPYAKIVIAATPPDTEITDDDASQVAPPEMMKALEYLGAHHLADAVSISDGDTEGDYRYGDNEVYAQDPGFLTAAADGIPVAVSSGDCGPAGELAVTTDRCEALTTGRAVGTWSDSPYVTSLGGVIPDYTYAGPDGQDGFSVWAVAGTSVAEGAGVSRLYGRPFYQDGVARKIGASGRSLPDITMDALHGTSQSAPEFAGVLALATQERGRDLGPINPLLYDELGPAGAKDGVIDVTTGNDDGVDGIPGYAAGRGFDIATGWGTVNATTFVPALAAADARQKGFGPLATQAAAELKQLESLAHAKPGRTTEGGRLTITGTDFLPKHPVTVRFAGRTLRTVHADSKGRVRFTVRVRALHTKSGRHTVYLKSMLLSEHASFQVQRHRVTHHHP